MDIRNIQPILKRLDGNIDQLEQALAPLMDDIAQTAVTLPYLERAKLYVLATYSIESLLFSELRLSGIDPKKHPVFKELARTRTYFQKIAQVESPPENEKRPMEQTVDTQAAIRFLKSDLSDDKDVKAKLSAQIMKERAKAEIQAAREKRLKQNAQ